jgi:hypothetical protein
MDEKIEASDSRESNEDVLALHRLVQRQSEALSRLESEVAALHRTVPAGGQTSAPGGVSILRAPVSRASLLKFLVVGTAGAAGATLFGSVSPPIALAAFQRASGGGAQEAAYEADEVTTSDNSLGGFDSTPEPNGYPLYAWGARCRGWVNGVYGATSEAHKQSYSFGDPYYLDPNVTFVTTPNKTFEQGIGVFGTSEDHTTNTPGNGPGVGVRGTGFIGGSFGSPQTTGIPLHLDPGSHSGRPSAGAYKQGDFYLDSLGALYICVTAGDYSTASKPVWKLVSTTSVTAARVVHFTVARKSAHTAFSWSMSDREGVLGFNVYAGRRRLNREMIKSHTAHSYRFTARNAGRGPFTLHTVLEDGTELTTSE